MSQIAVEKTDPDGGNEGFLDQTRNCTSSCFLTSVNKFPNPGICGTQWQSYIDRIYAAKGDLNLVRLSAVGDHPSGGGTALFARDTGNQHKSLAGGISEYML